MPSMPKTVEEEHGDDGGSSLQADVASFVSSLGFSSSSAGDLGSGFNDADFRKTGRINAKKKRLHNDNAAGLIPQPEESKKKSSTKRQHNVIDHESSGGAKKAAGVILPPEESQKKPSSKKKQKLDDHHHESSGGAKRAKTAIGRSSVGNSTFAEDRTKGNVASVISAKDSSKVYSNLSSLLQAGPWYEGLAALLSTTTVNESKDKHPYDGVLRKGAGEARRRGEALMEVVSAEFEKVRGKDSDMRWLMMARKTGTTADKVAAFTVLLQDNPLANLKALDALLGMVTTKGGKRHAVMGIDALKELFMTSLLPDRKLKYLAQQPLGQHDRDDERLLIFWHWEDCLKHRYEQFVSSLEEATKDKLPVLKNKAVKTIYELLKSKPEQERRLLSALVNKLGDPERKVASNAGYFLSCLLTSHPNMKMVVLEEVDSFLFRPHLGLRSKYQAVIFLNQTVLSNRGDGPKLAKRLIDIYFSLFKVITAGEIQVGTVKDHKDHKASHMWKDAKGKSKVKPEFDFEGPVEIDSRLLSALLTGVNRAFPFVAAEDIDILIQKHTPVLFRLVHSKNFNVGIQSLALLYQLLTKSHAISDRLYRALYAVVLSPGLLKSSKLEMFLGLVYKAVKSDINSKRMAAFAKRLMQVASQGSPQFTCGILLLLSEVLKTRPILWNAVTQPEDEDDETEHFHDIKEDLVIPIEEAAVPTSNGGVCNGEVNIACGREPRDRVDSSSESDELKCSVSDLDDDNGSSTGEEGDIIKVGKNAIKDIDREANAEDAFLSRVTKWTGKSGYNPRFREPSFCNADKASWWELTALASHVHPSVAAMAKTLLSGASILYKGNPLNDLTTNVFLDRFAEKKPKSRRKSGNWHGSSLSAPNRKTSTSNLLPIGMEFLQLSEQEVAPEDVVFHKFYTNRNNKKGKVRKEAKIKDDFTVVDGVDDDFLNEGSDDDEEIDELLEHDEGMEMDSDEFSEEDDESDVGWVLLQTDGSQEHSKKDRIAEEEADQNSGLGKKSGKEAHEATAAKGKRKKPSKTGKRASTPLPESAKISPFASLDDYSHLLGDQILDKDRKHKPSSSRKKRSRHTR